MDIKHNGGLIGDKELDAIAVVDAIWDKLLSCPESAVCLNEMTVQAKADEEVDENEEEHHDNTNRSSN